MRIDLAVSSSTLRVVLYHFKYLLLAGMSFWFVLAQRGAPQIRGLVRSPQVWPAQVEVLAALKS